METIDQVGDHRARCSSTTWPVETTWRPLTRVHLLVCGDHQRGWSPTTWLVETIWRPPTRVLSDHQACGDTWSVVGDHRACENHRPPGLWRPPGDDRPG
uniref:Uncharacterized protein n=1 Tax=Arundo donax TaxID=35708 RepID=A0A0A9AMR8_ARUDO